MARMTPTPRGGRTSRDRVRELVTFAVAFIFAFFVGRNLIQLLQYPPAIAQMGIFVVLYVCAYVGLWRLVSMRRDGPNLPQ